jgi:hypothetical protein
VNGSPLPRASAIRLAVPVGLIFACAVALGWSGGGDVVVPHAATPKPIPWSLPRPRPNTLAKDLATIANGKPWHRGYGGAHGAELAGAHGRGAAPPQWRLAGVVERSGEHFALVESGAGRSAKLHYFRVGEALPDGSVLVALTRDSATAQSGKPPKPRVYHLFGKKP